MQPISLALPCSWRVVNTHTHTHTRTHTRTRAHTHTHTQNRPTVFTGVDIGDDDVWTESGMVSRMGGVDVSVEVTPDGRGSSLWSTLFRPFCSPLSCLWPLGFPVGDWKASSPRFMSRSCFRDLHTFVTCPPCPPSWLFDHDCHLSDTCYRHSASFAPVDSYSLVKRIRLSLIRSD
jgi:hypothetical protein